MSLNMQLIPMTPNPIFEEPVQEKETWGLLTNAGEWSVKNAENCRFWNETMVHKDGTVIYEGISEADPKFQRPAAFKVDSTLGMPAFMNGPVALWEGQSIEAKTSRMSQEDLEELVATHHSNLFLYRVFLQGDDPILYVRMHLREQ